MALLALELASPLPLGQLDPCNFRDDGLASSDL